MPRSLAPQRLRTRTIGWLILAILILLVLIVLDLQRPKETPKPPRTSDPKSSTKEVPFAPKAPIVDSALSDAEALGISLAPKEVLARMSVVDVEYWGFDGETHQGQIVVDSTLAGEVQDIFRELKDLQFPIAKVIPVSQYGGKDQDSMAANNTSGFNYRLVERPSGAKKILSLHAKGRAIDLNPLTNPFVTSSGKSDSPYDPAKPGALSAGHPAVLAFKKRGWTWGGDWKHGKDYQHFEKR